MILDSQPQNSSEGAQKGLKASTTVRRKILLVEDEIVTAMVESRIIEHHGYDVITAVSGDEAIDLIKEDPSIELVLMDIELGAGIDGIETSRGILAWRNIPIVFLTSHSEREVAQRMRGITYYGYVIKNSNDYVLLSSIEMAFRIFNSHENRVKQRYVHNEHQIDLELQKELLLCAHNVCETLRGEYMDLYERTISDRIKAETIRYRVLVETTGAGYVMLDENGRVFDANQEYLRLSGYCDLNQIGGRNILEWTAEHHKEKSVRGLAQCVREGFIRNLEIDYADGNGKITPTEINATVMEENGRKRIILLCRDITGRRESEERINGLLIERERLLKEVHHRIKKIFKSSIWVG